MYFSKKYISKVQSPVVKYQYFVLVLVRSLESTLHTEFCHFCICDMQQKFLIRYRYQGYQNFWYANLIEHIYLSRKRTISSKEFLFSRCFLSFLIHIHNTVLLISVVARVGDVGGLTSLQSSKISIFSQRKINFFCVLLQRFFASS